MSWDIDGGRYGDVVDSSAVGYRLMKVGHNGRMAVVTSHWPNRSRGVSYV